MSEWPASGTERENAPQLFAATDIHRNLYSLSLGRWPPTPRSTTPSLVPVFHTTVQRFVHSHGNMGLLRLIFLFYGALFLGSDEGSEDYSHTPRQHSRCVKRQMAFWCLVIEKYPLESKCGGDFSSRAKFFYQIITF